MGDITRSHSTVNGAQDRARNCLRARGALSSPRPWLLRVLVKAAATQQFGPTPDPGHEIEASARPHMMMTIDWQGKVIGVVSAVVNFRK